MTTGEEATDTDTIDGCGNGIIDEGEECDDGGESATCNIDCTFSSCGDGIVNTSSGEECDRNAPMTETCVSQGYAGGQIDCDASCTLTVDSCSILQISEAKKFHFAWPAAPGAEFYRLLEQRTPEAMQEQLGGDISGTFSTHLMPLHLRHQASYELQACDPDCRPYYNVAVSGTLAYAVGFEKAFNLDAHDRFGRFVALSGDGTTLAVGAPGEDSSATGVGGNETSDDLPDAGAVYIYTHDGDGNWPLQAYVKAPNAGAGDMFAFVALNHDGNVLAVGAPLEDSDGVGVGGDDSNDLAVDSGATYIYSRSDDQWSFDAYIKAPNAEAGDEFGYVALNAKGDVLAVGAHGEDSSAIGVGGDDTNNDAETSGAVYTYTRDGSEWSFEAYIKAPNTDPNDEFGLVKLDDDGDTLAVGARGEASNAVGLDGDMDNNDAPYAGAVYLYTRDAMDQWSHQAYIKAFNTDATDEFGGTLPISQIGGASPYAVSLSGDGNTLAIGAIGEASDTTGVDAKTNNNAFRAGAVYIFTFDDILQQWSQQSYIKASNTDADDLFGGCVSLNNDGTILAVGALWEDGNALGLGGVERDNSLPNGGAAYVFTRDTSSVWSQASYVKPATPTTGFGALALDGSGNVLAVASHDESTPLPEFDDDSDITAPASGAVYLY